MSEDINYRDIQATIQAEQDRTCQEAELCEWVETSELPHPPYGKSYRIHIWSHPDCPVHGENE